MALPLLLDSLILAPLAPILAPAGIQFVSLAIHRQFPFVWLVQAALVMTLARPARIPSDIRLVQCSAFCPECNSLRW